MSFTYSSQKYTDTFLFTYSSHPDEEHPRLPSSPLSVAVFRFPLMLRAPAVTKLMEMHGDNTVEDVGMEVEREDEEGEEVAEE